MWFAIMGPLLVHDGITAVDVRAGAGHHRRP